MNDYASTQVERIEPDERDVRALEQYLTVLPRERGTYEVVSESGKSYTVDDVAGTCECADAEYRDVECKHARRVAFATGERTVPDGVDVAGDLGEHVDEAPQVVATDGGVVVADDDGEILDEDDDDRPEDCSCWNANGELPCWSCYKAGYDVPNPDEPGADEGDSEASR